MKMWSGVKDLPPPHPLSVLMLSYLPPPPPFPYCVTWRCGDSFSDVLVHWTSVGSIGADLAHRWWWFMGDVRTLYSSGSCGDVVTHLEMWWCY